MIFFFLRNDDWAFANDVDSKQLYFQTEEFLLQANINRFHNRRYDIPFPGPSINSVTAQAFHASVGSKANEYNSGSGSPAASTGGSQSNSGTTSGSSAPITANMFFEGTTGSPAMAAATAIASHFAPGVHTTLASVAETDILTPVDNNLLSVLSREVKLSTEFKKNYEIWLQREVFQNKINWDQLMDGPTGDYYCLPDNDDDHNDKYYKNRQQHSRINNCNNNTTTGETRTNIESGTSTVIRGASMSIATSTETSVTSTSSSIII